MRRDSTRPSSAPSTAKSRAANCVARADLGVKYLASFGTSNAGALTGAHPTDRCRRVGPTN